MNKQHTDTMSYYSTLFQKYNVDDTSKDGGFKC